MIAVQDSLNAKYNSQIITEYAFNGAGILEKVTKTKCIKKYIYIYAERSPLCPPTSLGDLIERKESVISFVIHALILSETYSFN